MAKSNNNVVMFGASGKIGDLLIFRQRSGKTIIAKIAQRSKAFTADQIAVTEKFKAAASFAKSALKNIANKLLYKSKAVGDVTPFNVAIADYFNPPIVKEVNYAAYTGLVGSTIRIDADDDVKVDNVHVTITSAGGMLLEEGDALIDANGAYFVYAATQVNNALSGTTIEVVASDLAANKTTKEVIIP